RVPTRNSWTAGRARRTARPAAGHAGRAVRRARPAVQLFLVGTRPPPRALAADRAQRRHPAGTDPQRRPVTGNDTERAGRHASVTWYGQAGFRLAAGGSRVLIDPVLTDPADRRHRPPVPASDPADAALVLRPHDPAAHRALPFLRELCAVNPGARIVVPLPVVGVAAAGGIDRARLAGAVPGEELHDRDVTVH